MAAVLLLAVFAGGCGSEKAAEVSTPNSAAEIQEQNIFRVNLLSKPFTLDPAQGVTESELLLARALYSTLVEYKEGDVVPALAKSWRYSADGKELTIQLQDNLKFSNGRPLTSSDVEFSLERVQDPGLASPYAPLLSAELGERETAAAAITITSTDSLVIRFPVPRKDFIELLAHPCFSIVSRESVQKNNYGFGADFSSAQNVVTSGPLSIVEWVDNQIISLEPNKHYFPGPLSLDRIELVIDSSSPTTLYDFGTEYLDMAFLRTPDIKRLTTEYPDVAEQLVAGSASEVYFLAINPNTKFFNTLQTRQAVMGVVNVSALVESSEIFVPAARPLRRLPRGGAGSNIDPKSLLWSAGYVGEKKPPQLVLGYPPGEISRFIAEHLKGQLESTLDLKVNMKESPFQRRQLFDNGADLSLIRWTIPYPGPSAYFPYFFSQGENPFTYEHARGEMEDYYFSEIGKMEKAAQREYYYNLISDAISQEMVLNSLVEAKNVYVIQSKKDSDHQLVNILLGHGDKGNTPGN